MEPAAIVSSPTGVLALLVASVALSEALARHPKLKRFPAALIVIILGAVLANLRIIPPAGAGGPVYDFIFDHVISFGIFLLLLPVNLAALKRAGAPMLGAFAIGAAGVAVGVFLATALVPLRPLVGDQTSPLAGMFAATYIGGGANFNAVAAAFDVQRNGGVYAAATVVDNVMTDVWLIVTLSMTAILTRTKLFGAPRPAPAPPPVAPKTDKTKNATTALEISLPFALAAAAVVVSGGLAEFFAAQGFSIPPILIVTTLALVAAQWPPLSRLAGAHALGLFAILLFLAVVGANADLAALAAAGALTPLLFAYVAIIFAGHAAILLGAGALLKIEPAILAVASNANIAGSSTAFVLAEAEGRDDLVLPAILVGSLGNALGTYVGFAVAALLK